MGVYGCANMDTRALGQGVGIAVKAAVSLAGGYKEKKDIICASGSLEPNWVTSNVPPYPPQKTTHILSFSLLIQQHGSGCVIQDIT